MIAVRHAHAAANQEVIAGNLVVLNDGQETKILSVDVDAVVFRQGEPGFEFPRQVNLAV